MPAFEIEITTLGAQWWKMKTNVSGGWIFDSDISATNLSGQI